MPVSKEFGMKIDEKGWRRKEGPRRCNRKGPSSPNRSHRVYRAKENDMKYRTGPAADWVSLLQEIIIARSWRPLLRAAVLMVSFTFAAMAAALVLFLVR
jgi:hypothetical protein